MEIQTKNPISKVKEGQKSIQDVVTLIRDFTRAFDRVYESTRDVKGTQRLNADLPKNFKERVEAFQISRCTIEAVS